MEETLKTAPAVEADQREGISRRQRNLHTAKLISPVPRHAGENPVPPKRTRQLSKHQPRLLLHVKERRRGVERSVAGRKFKSS